MVPDTNTIFPNAGKDMYKLIEQLYPICRSITGQGVRDTLGILKQFIPLEIQQVPTGTPVLDWTVPNEWNITDAYVKDSNGERVIDFQRSNLHILNYSIPIFRKHVQLAELIEHLFTLPEHPDWIPHKTSYYQENWGFCLSHNDLLRLKEGEYEVCIDSTLQPGNLNYGEYFLPGNLEDEVLISTHICHPSLCNDNLSGIALTTFLAKYLSSQPRRYSFRFLFIPTTIGSITWLARNENILPLIKHGLVVACVGDRGSPHYKRSRIGNADIDRSVELVLKQSGQEYAVEDFSPYGYDERQYSSPGFNLAIGSLSRTPYGRYPEYHTSADNLDFIQPESLADSLSIYIETINVLENNRRYWNTNPKGEPQLGRRGLYSAFGGRNDIGQMEMAVFWVLNFSDGQHDLLGIAEKSGYPFRIIKEAADLLLNHGLLKEEK